MTLRHSHCRLDSMEIGVVHDAGRLELIESSLLGDDPSCPKGQAPGLVALLRTRDGRRLAFASVHFKAGGGAKSWTERQAQWATLAAEIPDVGERLRAPVIVAGDFNSTGYLKTDSHERPAAGLRRDLGSLSGARRGRSLIYTTTRRAGRSRSSGATSSRRWVVSSRYSVSRSTPM